MAKLHLSKNARTVLEHRYLKKDEKGNITETPEQLFRRTAHNVALAELKYKYKEKVNKLLKKYSKKEHDFWWLATKTKELQTLAKKDKDTKRTEEEFFELLTSLDFMPNSPTLFNAGRKLQQLAACFVLPIEDDMNSIFKTLWMTAVIHQSGGGTGFSFTKLRPKNDAVSSTSGTASGPISFMKIFDATTEQIKQGGKRRGANMGILRVDHPDIEEFTKIKQNQDTLKNFNISVAVTDKFMQAVEKGSSYALINPRTGKAVKREDARKIFTMLCESAWTAADPGIIFIDEMNRHNPVPKLGQYESTNPCGEIPLLPYEACNLGSINLGNMVKNNAINYEKLKTRIQQAVHFLDNVIDMSNYSFPEIFEIVHANRKLGLGVMGFADMLFQLKIQYNTDKALKTAEDIMKFIAEEAKKASIELAKTRGVFPNWKKSIYLKKKERLRNATLTAIAPTGTISIIANCSSGIEPLFAIAFKHNVLDHEELTEINKHFVEAAKEEGVYNDKLIEKVSAQGTLKGAFVPAWMKRIFVTATEIPTEWHIKMQAAFQKYIDNAVSKTINFSADAAVEDVMKAYKLACQLKCKGVTIYRYGSKQKQVLTFGTQKAIPAKEQCPNCNSTLAREAGCVVCKKCGYGRCES